MCNAGPRQGAKNMSYQYAPSVMLQILGVSRYLHLTKWNENLNVSKAKLIQTMKYDVYVLETVLSKGILENKDHYHFTIISPFYNYFLSTVSNLISSNIHVQSRYKV